MCVQVGKISHKKHPTLFYFYLPQLRIQLYHFWPDRSTIQKFSVAASTKEVLFVNHIYHYPSITVKISTSSIANIRQNNLKFDEKSCPIKRTVL